MQVYTVDCKTIIKIAIKLGYNKHGYIEFMAITNK